MHNRPLSKLAFVKKQMPREMLLHIYHFVTNNKGWGSGCGSVGRAVASNIRGPQFESNLNLVIGKIYIEHFVYLFTINCIEKTK